MQIVKKVFSIIFCLVLSFVLVCCNEEVQTKELTGVQLIEKGKDIYYVGDEFDLYGYTLELTYNIGDEEYISLTSEMCDDLLLNEVGEKTINVTYTKDAISFSTSFKVTIKAKEEVEPIEPKDVKLIGIDLLTKGKDIYCIGLDFDLTGYEFIAKYDDNTSKNINITLNNLSYEPFSETDSDYKEMITVAYTENGTTVSTIFEVTVMNEWDYEDYIDELEFNKLLEQAENDINEVLQGDITEDIDLPEIEDYNYRFKIIYTSSNEKVFSTSGKVNRQEEDVTITLNVVISEIGSNNVLKEHEYQLNVPGLGPIDFPDLTNKKVTIGYFYEGTYSPLTASDGNKIDILVYSFGRMNDGKVSITSLTHINQVMAWRREYKMRVILALGGGGSEGAAAGFSQAVATAEARQKFIDSIMEIVEEYNFDGIDMDWEYPGWDGLTDSTSQDVHNFTLFLKELRATFDAYKEGMLITAAVVGTESINKFYEATEVAKYVDYLNVMTYDCNYSSKASHHTAPKDTIWSTESAIINWLAKGVDSKKIVIGAAFYGKIFTLSTPVSNPKDSLGKSASSVKTIQYTEIYNSYINNPDYKEYLDSAADAYYISDGNIFISYDNPYSIQVKADLVKEYDLGGIMFWDYGSDTTGQLLSAVYSGLNKINRENGIK